MAGANVDVPNEVLKDVVEALRQVALEAAGSKRVFTFVVWLVGILWRQPDLNTLLVTLAALLMLWWLLIAYPGNDPLVASATEKPASGSPV